MYFEERLEKLTDDLMGMIKSGSSPNKNTKLKIEELSRVCQILLREISK